MTLGDVIKNYRIEHKLSMDAFSERSGISKAYISLLEKNKHPKTGKPIAPSIKLIKQVADAIDIDFNELFNMIDGDVTLNEKNDNKGGQIMYEVFEQLLQKFGVTSYQVSKATGISQSTLSSWKARRNLLSGDKATKIAEYFGVSVDFLMTGKEPEATVKIVDENNNIVVLDDETLALIDSLRNKPEMKMLFSVSKNATKEDILKTVKIIEALKDGQ